MSFTLGQEVQFTGTVEKVRRHDPARTEYQRSGLPTTSWDYRPEPVEQPEAWERATATHNTGVIVGKRTIADQRIEGGWDEPLSARAVRGTHRPAWLVAWNLHRKPVLVLESQIVVKESA